ncbi:MAG: ATP-binding protein [Acaryochloris sp. SU_5_25]|nr:ATP-binding protein [Acaryochloris sp. SU_5_25]
MDFEQSIDFVNEHLEAAKAGRRVTEPERLVLKAAWEKFHYGEVATETNNSDYLRCRVAPELWRLLTDVFGHGEKIKKSNYRAFVEWRFKQLELHSEGLPSVGNTRQVLGGHPPELTGFCGRETELMQLFSAALERRCIFLHGPVGIGKSALASRLVKRLQTDRLSKYQTFIWKSIHYGPSLEELVTELLSLVNPQGRLTNPNLPKTVTSEFIEHLKRYPCLVVLDGAEGIFRQDNQVHKDYVDFIRRLIQEQTQSCPVIVGQEPFSEILAMGREARVKVMHLGGLEQPAAKELLKLNKLLDPDHWGELIQKYRGNPLALEIVSNRIQEFFGGSVEGFLKYHSTWMGSPFLSVLQEQFASMSAIEQQIMIRLAESKDKQPHSLDSLLLQLREKVEEVSSSAVIESLKILVDRSFVERTLDAEKKSQFGLTPTIRKCILTRPINLGKEQF